MVRFICTRTGEKSRGFLFSRAAECIKDGRRGYFLVPEQQVLAYEDEAGRLLPPSAPLSFTVTSFSLLSDIASRRFGALSYKVLSKPQKVLFMWKAIKETAPFLSLYGKTSPESLCARMLECTDELKAAGITPEALTDAAAYLSEAPVFAKKLSDIAKVYSAYGALIGNRYSDINDELKKLLTFLDSRDMFSGQDIFIDSFTDFTPLQLSVIKHMIQKADNVYISLPADPERDGSIQFECIRKTYADISAICKRYEKQSEILRLDTGDEEKTVLSYLSRELLSVSPAPYKGEYAKKERAEAFACLDTQEEICACVNLIKRALFEGYRLSDIALIARDPSKYERLLAFSAEDAGIPLFTSDKSLISDSCFAVYIISLLRIISGGWRRADVITHLKCGLSGFAFEDISRFDLYTSRWDTDGRAQFCGADFSAPYRRFSKESKEDDEFVISSNKIKKELFPRICALEEKLTDAKTLKEMLVSLFEYTESSDAAGGLRRMAEDSAKRGDRRTSEVLSRTYSAAIRLLDDIAHALDGEPAMPIKDLCSMIELVFSSAEIGSIPTRKDEVILADASLYRSFGHKVIIALGMCEGEFPRAVQSSGLITDAEKDILKNEGLDISSTAVMAASKEYFFLWKTVTMAKEQLYMTYPQRSASEGERKEGIAVRNLAAILGREHVRVFSDCMHELMYDAHTAFAGLLSHDSESGFLRLAEEYCKEKNGSQIRLGGKDASLSGEHSISEESACGVLPLPLSVSPTALEAYNKCAFSYFCSSLLRLDNGRKNEFSALISGTLVHSILEKYLRSGKEYTSEESASICERIADEYYTVTCPEHLTDNERLKLNFTRAAINASLLARFVTYDLEDSGFTPAEFEKQILSPLGEEKSDVTLNGRIDRIDTASTQEGDFLRIIDYKSGSKHFSLEEAYEGTELQLPLYLSALIREGKDVAPGGFMYLSSAVPWHDVSSAAELEDAASLDAALVAKIDASGILNSLFAKKKSSKLRGLADGELREVLRKTEDIALGTVKSMRGGNISAMPKKNGDSYTCKYCPYVAVCRSKKVGRNDREQ